MTAWNDIPDASTGLASPRALDCGAFMAWASVAELPAETLAPAEAALADGVRSARRRRELLAGRLAARRALRAAGLEAGPVLRDDSLPRFPAGTAGSIAHSGGVAVAIAAPLSAVVTVGVDLEVGRSGLAAGPARLLCAAAERRGLSPGEAPRALLELACAREALYKAACMAGAHRPRLCDVRCTRVPGGVEAVLMRDVAPGLPRALRVCVNVDRLGDRLVASVVVRKGARRGEWGRSLHRAGTPLRSHRLTTAVTR